MDTREVLDFLLDLGAEMKKEELNESRSYDMLRDFYYKVAQIKLF